MSGPSSGTGSASGGNGKTHTAPPVAGGRPGFRPGQRRGPMGGPMGHGMMMPVEKAGNFKGTFRRFLGELRPER
jgi:ATP-binding cassette, subfamily B, multidrug efflux pump